MVAKSFQVGDLVWAKMKGYPPWPGKIIEPPVNAKSPKVKKSHHYVFFFGSDNHAWIPDEMILLHNERLVEEYGNKKKTGHFQTAVETIVNISKDNSKYHKQHESFETHSEDASPKYKEHESSFEKYASSDISSKPRNPHSNSVSKKIKKKNSGKKLPSSKKPIMRKRTYSSDRSEIDSYEYTSPIKSSRLEETYANLLANIPPNINYNGETMHPSPPSAPSTGLLGRKYIERPETPTIDLSVKSEALKNKDVQPTAKKIGFLGLGKLGQGIVKNLQHSGHSVTVWNRTTEKCTLFAEQLNVEVASTPADVVMASDITFCCVSDADAAKALVFGNCGILKGLESSNVAGKGYVEMTSMDPKTSQAIAEEIRVKGGRYLEAPLSGSRAEAHEGTLFILAAGDQSLYKECESCLNAASKKHKFISPDVGTASKLSLIHNMLIGTVYAAVAESLALVSRAGLDGKDFLDILKYGVLHSEVVLNKGMSMIESNYVSNTSLKHMQKDLNLGLMLGSSVEQPTPIIAAANEVYKHCKLLRYGDHDVSAVFEGTRP